MCSVSSCRYLRMQTAAFFFAERFRRRFVQLGGTNLLATLGGTLQAFTEVHGDAPFEHWRAVLVARLRVATVVFLLLLLELQQVAEGAEEMPCLLPSLS